jgi:membrane protein required for beta-lactamase induction
VWCVCVCVCVCVVWFGLCVSVICVCVCVWCIGASQLQNYYKEFSATQTGG